MFKKLLYTDAEYRTLFWAMILSICAGIAEYYGFHAGSNTMGVAMVHMGLHAVIFGGMLVLTALARNGIYPNDSFDTFNRGLDWVAIIAIVIFLAVRVISFTHQVEGDVLHDLTRFRSACLVTIVLLTIQSVIIHVNKEWTCGALCHLAWGHVMIDVFAFSALFVVSFLPRTWFLGSDILFFALSIFMTVRIVMKIYKSGKFKKQAAKTV